MRVRNMMNRSLFLLLILAVGLMSLSFIAGCDSFKVDTVSSPVDVKNLPDAEQSVPVSDSGVVAYYFHGNYRCASCRAIESYTKEALELYFSDELASGKLEFRAVNVEEKGNEHFVQDYKLYTKSVVLSRVVDGKEVDYKNLEGVWQLLNNRQRFFDYVRKETEVFLGGGSS